jgi:hypothetical protein
MTKLKLAVYVIHGKKLAGRQTGIDKLRQTLSSSEGASSSTTGGSSGTCHIDRFEIVDDVEPEGLQNFADSVDKIADVSSRDLVPPFDKLSAPIHVNQLSNAMNHLAALRRIEKAAVTDPDLVYLVLEDDVLYNEETVTGWLARTLSEAPRNWDVVFLGLPSTIKQTDEEVRFQRTDEVFKVLPACDSYLITGSMATRLVKRFLPVRFSTNVHLSWLFEQVGGTQVGGTQVNAYVVSHNVFLDGSKLGAYTSSLNVNNRLSWNPWYIRLGTMVQKQNAVEVTRDAGIRANLEREIDDLFQSMHFKTHPDILYMYALSLVRRGSFEAARAYMEDAYKMYVGNGCIINRSSEFLNAYCDLFRHLQ